MARGVRFPRVPCPGAPRIARALAARAGRGLRRFAVGEAGYGTDQSRGTGERCASGERRLCDWACGCGAAQLRSSVPSIEHGAVSLILNALRRRSVDARDTEEPSHVRVAAESLPGRAAAEPSPGRVAGEPSSGRARADTVPASLGYAAPSTRSFAVNSLVGYCIASLIFGFVGVAVLIAVLSPPPAEPAGRAAPTLPPRASSSIKAARGNANTTGPERTGPSPAGSTKRARSVADSHPACHRAAERKAGARAGGDIGCARASSRTACSSTPGQSNSGRLDTDGSSAHPARRGRRRLARRRCFSASQALHGFSSGDGFIIVGQRPSSRRVAARESFRPGTLLSAPR